MQVSTSPTTADADERLRELRLTTDRMANARREREAERADARRPVIRYTTNRDFPAPQTESQQPAPMLWPHSPLRGIYLGPLRHPQYRPVSPAPVPPGFQMIQPGNRQLMRPIVSNRD